MVGFVQVLHNDAYFFEELFLLLWMILDDIARFMGLTKPEKASIIKVFDLLIRYFVLG